MTMVISTERRAWFAGYDKQSKTFLATYGVAGLAFALPFLVYLWTLAPTIYNLDSAELTTAAATGGIIRATGYPLYLILGRLWSHLPVGDVGYRMNLLSAICGAGTLLLAERILFRLGAKGWARLGAIGLLGTAPYFWALSLIAEVYTLHTVLMAGLIFALLRWRDNPTPGRLAVAVFIAAASLGNHMATVLLVPGCVMFVLLVGKGNVLRPRSFIPALIALLLGLSLYLYLPWQYEHKPVFNYAGTYDASGQFNPINLQSATGLWWLVSGRAFAGQMGGYTLAELGHELLHFGEQLWQSFFGLGIGPALLGFLILFRRDKNSALMLTLMFAANVLFYASYRVIDKDTMFLPAYLVWAIWLGLGYQKLLDWLAQPSTNNRRSRQVVWLLQTAMASIVLLALLWNWGQVNQSSDWSTRQRGENILAQVEADAIVLGWWDTVPAIQYLQLVEGQRPDVLAINRFLINGDDMLQLIREEASQRPVYINNPPADLLQTMRIEPVGVLYRLYPQ